MAVWDSARRSAASRYSHPWLAEIVFALDAWLRRCQTVVGYTSHPSCVFRLRVARTHRTLVLRDKTRMRAGQRMIHRLGENIAQNAAALRLDALMRVRVPIYLSRRDLERKFGEGSETAAGAIGAP